LAKGFTEDQFEMAVDEYSVLDVSIFVAFCSFGIGWSANL